VVTNYDSISIAAKRQEKSRPFADWVNLNKHKWVPYIFISPFFILFAVFGLFPLLFSLYLSFHYWDPIAGINAMEWVGIENYVFVLTDDWFHKSVVNTITLAFGAGIPQHFVAIPLAYFLVTYLNKSRNFVIGAYFLPYITTIVAISLVFTTMFSRDYGVVNLLLTQMGNFEVFGFKPLSLIFPTEKIDWAQPQYIKPMIAFVVFWRFVGWNTVLYMAAMQTIPKDLYEAAKIDGANTLQQFRFITLPLLKPMAFLAVTLTIIGNLQMFEEPFVITNGTGGIAQAGKTAAMHMYNTAFVEGDFGTASAVSWLLFLLIAGLTWGNNMLFSEKDK